MWQSYGNGRAIKIKKPRATVALTIYVAQYLAGAEAFRRDDHKIMGFEHFNGLINLIKAENHHCAFGLALHKGIHVFHVDAIF